MDRVIVEVKSKGKKRRKFESIFGIGPCARKLGNFLSDKGLVGKAVKRGGPSAKK